VEPSSIIKVVGAFAAGVVVALGSALLYVRVSDTARVRPVAQTAAVPAQLKVDQLSKTEISATNPARPAPPAAAKDRTPQIQPIEHPKLRRAVAETRRKSVKPTPRDPPSLATVEAAQNGPPVNAPADSSMPVALPDATVNGAESQAPLPQDTPAAVAPSPISVPLHQPHVVMLQSGTSLVVRLDETLSTDHNYTGDTFRAALESPIIVDGFIIADKGSKVLGSVVGAQKAGRVEGGSNLTLSLTEISTTDGQRVKIDTNVYDKRGPASTLEDAAKIAGGAAIGAIIGAVTGGAKGAGIGAGAGGAAGTGAVLLTRGKPAVLPSETRLTFRLAAPVTITEKLNY
jgi:hypothetical protein